MPFEWKVDKEQTHGRRRTTNHIVLRWAKTMKLLLTSIQMYMSLLSHCPLTGKCNLLFVHTVLSVENDKIGFLKQSWIRTSLPCTYSMSVLVFHKTHFICKSYYCRCSPKIFQKLFPVIHVKPLKYLGAIIDYYFINLSNPDFLCIISDTEAEG